MFRYYHINSSWIYQVYNIYMSTSMFNGFDQERNTSNEKELESIISVCGNNAEIDSSQAKTLIGKMASIIQNIIRNPNDA